VNAAEFERRFRELLSEQKGPANVGCLACERCERCSDSTFLEECKNVARSHYCTRCVDCTECTHSVGCAGCLSCNHCESCERCVGSAYLIRCVGMSGCTYCFGCVALSRKDFHILNEPFTREEYFAKVKELRRVVRI
jgi:hypothetical protein